MEEACKTKNFNNISKEHPERVQHIYIWTRGRSTSKTTIAIGIKVEALKDSKKKMKDDKKRGRKSTKQLIQDIGSQMVDAGQVQALEGHFTPPQ